MPRFWQEKTPQYNAHPIVPPRMLRFLALSGTPPPRLVLTYRDTPSSVTAYYLLRCYWEVASKAKAWDAAYAHQGGYNGTAANASRSAKPPPRPDPSKGLDLDLFVVWLRENIAAVNSYESCRLKAIVHAGLVAIPSNESDSALFTAFNYDPWSLDFESLDTLENHIYSSCRADFKSASHLIQFLSAENAARWAHWRDRAGHWQGRPSEMRAQIFCIHNSCVSAQGWVPTDSQEAKGLAPPRGLGIALAEFLGIPNKDVESEMTSQPPTALLEHFFGKGIADRIWPHSLFAGQPPSILRKFSTNTSSMDLTDNDARLLANFRKAASERFMTMISGSSIARRAITDELHWKRQGWCDTGPYRCASSAIQL